MHWYTIFCANRTMTYHLGAFYAESEAAAIALAQDKYPLRGVWSAALHFGPFAPTPLRYPILNRVAA